MLPSRAATDEETICRKIYEDLSTRAVAFLESHPLACSVRLQDQPGVTLLQLRAWEAANHPHVLPDDYRAFLAITNGMTVRWRLRFDGQVRPFGVVHLNQLEEVKPLPAVRLVSAPQAPTPSTLPSASLAAPRGGIDDADADGTDVAAAFDLDSECRVGRVALLYRGGAGACGACGGFDPNCCGATASAPAGTRAWPRRPQVWFQDLACRWHFVAESFADYFRLLVTHLGVPHWQYAFTDVGLDPVARYWLALFCPERLAMASTCGPGGRAGRDGRGVRPARGTAAGASQAPQPRTASSSPQRRPSQQRPSQQRAPRAPHRASATHTGGTRGAGAAGGGMPCGNGRAGAREEHRSPNVASGAGPRVARAASTSATAGVGSSVGRLSSTSGGVAGAAEQRRQTRPASASRIRGGTGSSAGAVGGEPQHLLRSRSSLRP